MGHRLTQMKRDWVGRRRAVFSRFSSVFIGAPSVAGLLFLLSTAACLFAEEWELRGPVRPEPPAVKRSGWVRTPIDAFVLARLEQQDLAPSPEADRRTLIRRVTFDLTGLPPTPEEVRAFLDDPSSDAYEKLVDRLLSSPRYGERWARH